MILIIKLEIEIFHDNEILEKKRNIYSFNLKQIFTSTIFPFLYCKINIEYSI